MNVVGDGGVAVNRGGFTQFTGSSSAANATMTDFGGTMIFANRSTAGNAAITTHGFALVQFEDASSAAYSTLTTNKTGETNFEETSTAANSILINYRSRPMRITHAFWVRLCRTKAGCGGPLA